MSAEDDLRVCHACRRWELPCVGACRCAADGKGEDIRVKAATHKCPLHLFDSRGLGDDVAKLIHAATFGLLQPCGGCEQRQEALNGLVPYRRSVPGEPTSGAD